MLYLEWAPSNILSQNVKAAKDGPASVVSEENIKSVLLEQSVQGLTEDEIDPDRAEVRHVSVCWFSFVPIFFFLFLIACYFVFCNSHVLFLMWCTINHLGF